MKPKEYKSPLIEKLLDEVTPEELERADNQMSKKQTAVEWLISELRESKDFYRVINELNQRGSSVRHILNEALQMEKQQIMDACSVGYKDGIFYANGEQWEFETSEQYYEQTYESNRI